MPTNRIIYRIDDRFIHGQVMEGWVNYYNIHNIVIVNDAIANDEFQTIIYKSILSSDTKLTVATVEDYKHSECATSGSVLNIFGSVTDLYEVLDNIPEGAYINIGCLAHKDCATNVSETVCIGDADIEKLQEILARFDVFVHKVPWEKPINMLKFFEKKGIIKR